MIAVLGWRVAMRGLSLWTWTSATAQGAAWVVYGFAGHLRVVAIPNLVVTPICAAILAVRISHRVHPEGS